MIYLNNNIMKLLINFLKTWAKKYIEMKGLTIGQIATLWLKISISIGRQNEEIGTLSFWSLILTMLNFLFCVLTIFLGINMNCITLRRKSLYQSLSQEPTKNITSNFAKRDPILQIENLKLSVCGGEHHYSL